MRHAFNTKLIKSVSGAKHYMAREVNQYDLQGNFIKKWKCIKNIERKLKFDNRNICACCRGKRKTAYGYKWAYAEKTNAHNGF